MTEFAYLPGRIIPAEFGGGFAVECHPCLRAVRSVFDPVTPMPWRETEKEAQAAFLAHMTEVHPEQAPTPDGCGLCGQHARFHGEVWAPGTGRHTYSPPTPEQRLFRMRSRRAAQIA